MNIEGKKERATVLRFTATSRRLRPAEKQPSNWPSIAHKAARLATQNPESARVLEGLIDDCLLLPARGEG